MKTFQAKGLLGVGCSLGKEVSRLLTGCMKCAIVIEMLVCRTIQNINISYGNNRSWDTITVTFGSMETRTIHIIPEIPQ